MFLFLECLNYAKQNSVLDCGDLFQPGPRRHQVPKVQRDLQYRRVAVRPRPRRPAQEQSAREAAEARGALRSAG